MTVTEIMGMVANRSFLYQWITSGMGLLFAIAIVPGLRYQGGILGFILLALIFGLVNALLKPLLAILSCPLVLLTLGFFMLVLNALLLGLTAWLGRSIGIPFYVNGFASAFWGGIVVSLVSFLSAVFLQSERR